MENNPNPANNPNNNSNKIPGWVGTLLLIVILNILSAIFDWGWFFY